MKRIIFLFIFFSNVAYSQTAEAYFYNGWTKYNNGDYDGAISDYTKAIELNPNYEMALFYRGTLLLQEGYNTDAIPDFDRVIKLNSNHSEAYYRRSGVASFYDANLSSLFTKPEIRNNFRDVYHNYVIRVSPNLRDSIRDIMQKNGVK